MSSKVYRTLGLIGALVVAVSGSALAQNSIASCQGVLQNGIYDTRISSSEESFSENILNWLSSQEFHDKNQVKDAALKLGFTIPGNIEDFDLDYRKRTTNRDVYSKAFANYLRQDTSRMRRFREDSKNINASIIAAWRDCVTASRRTPGIHCTALYRGNSPDEIEVQVEMNVLGPMPSRLNLYIASKSDHIVPVAFRSGMPLHAPGTTIVFRRTGANKHLGGHVMFETRQGYRCATVAYFAETDKKPVPPCVEYDKQSNLCTRCEFDTSGEVVPGGARFQKVPRGGGVTYTCPNMKAGTVTATFSGVIDLEGATNVEGLFLQLLGCGLDKTPASSEPASGAGNMHSLTVRHVGAKVLAKQSCPVQLLLGGYRLPTEKPGAVRNASATGKATLTIQVQ